MSMNRLITCTERMMLQLPQIHPIRGENLDFFHQDCGGGAICSMRSVTTGEISGICPGISITANSLHHLCQTPSGVKASDPMGLRATSLFMKETSSLQTLQDGISQSQPAKR